MPSSLDQLQFQNHFTEELPADSSLENRSRQVYNACFSRVSPRTASAPTLVAWSQEMADMLGLDSASIHSKQFADVFTGNVRLPGMDCHAMCYGGHQFGNWAGQLGDGRAILLGEVKTPHHGIQALQLKGAGPTPYSRHADGLAVLRSSVREFLCSEAMHHLGVATTRALSLTLTGDQVVRDMFYDGRAAYEPGAVVCRVAPSFLRLGNYEIFAARDDKQTLKTLVDFTLKHHFPGINGNGKSAYLEFFRDVCLRTADTIIHWQRVGFVHGVMNTDNLSVLGLTIDYGPYGWLEDYDLDWTPNTTDAEMRRYTFGKQAKIARWNLVRFANALYPLILDTKALQAILQEFTDYYEYGWYKMMAGKLGLSKLHPEDDKSFIAELEQLLESRETDMTLFYRALAHDDVVNQDLAIEQRLAPLLTSLYEPVGDTTAYVQKASEWLNQYTAKLAADSYDSELRVKTMNSSNPLYVLRNYLAQIAIDRATEGDYSRIQEQLEVLRKPYQVQPGKEEFAEKRPEWARNRAGCSMLSCSS